MISKIDRFQQENVQDVDLLVVNRANELLYDSRKPHLNNVREVIASEESRPLTPQEIILLNQQIHRIQQNMQYRYETGIYAPCRSEVDMAKTAVSNIAELICAQKDGREQQVTNFMFQQKFGWQCHGQR